MQCGLLSDPSRGRALYAEMAMWVCRSTRVPPPELPGSGSKGLISGPASAGPPLACTATIACEFRTPAAFDRRTETTSLCLVPIRLHDLDRIAVGLEKRRQGLRIAAQTSPHDAARRDDAHEAQLLSRRRSEHRWVVHDHGGIVAGRTGIREFDF